ncbi:DUF4920 domain-containing protein [Confluentibacter flavum]|uniref:DUF4920 domain-containing protein n=1 Tax=Confluentibacter flavum TaxID=1909700 RepID=A0A2N3HMS4_9FLAO|nr:DUF4920 domain-containing protein [Confluentibacter flavum]PKQ46227.1 DUF4920 domain-containing protein [Confluentibacter flavum]
MSVKNILLLSICVFLSASCKQNAEKTNQKDEVVEYASFGKNITEDDALEVMDAIIQYEVMSVGDTIDSKIAAKVSSVCQAKGCWMTLDLEDGKEIMVKFKDYGFFVPKDIVGKEVVINGLAFIDEIPVDEQQHYAEDAGKTTAEIASIVQPKRTLSFEADGVLIKQ